MTEIYDYIVDCDNIVIASPIYFSQPTGKLLDVCSRFQTYFAAKHFRNQTPFIKPKKGIVILVGGGDGNPEDAYKTVCTILHHFNVTEVYPLIGSFNTNKLSATKDKKAINIITRICHTSLNQLVWYVLYKSVYTKSKIEQLTHLHCCSNYKQRGQPSVN